MNDSLIIAHTITFVKKELENAEGGHDWFHIERVYKNAILISKTEKVDSFIVSLGALLHDIADSKFYNGDEAIGPKKASDFLNYKKVPKDVIAHVIKIIENISFKGGNKKQQFFSNARCFNYGGYKNRKLYDPEIKPNLNMSPEVYKASDSPTINHFYEKLLLLKDKMNTKTGKKIAQKRHEYMKGFLEQFYKEWDGEL